MVVIYLLAGLVPVMIILGITYMEMKKILWARETTILESYVSQTTDSMDNELEIYNNLSKYISYNQSIAKILSADQSAYQNYEQFSTVIDPLLASIMYFHEDVNQVTIYTDASDVKHGSTVAPLKDLADGTHAYDDLDNNIHWHIDLESRTAFSVSRMAMLEQKGAKGVLYVGVDYDSVFQPFYTETMFDNYGLIIEDEYGHMIFNKNTFADEQSAYELDVDKFDVLREMENSGYQFIDKTSKATGWNICVYKPNRLIISSVRPILIIAVAALLVSMLAGILCINMVSEFITKRIKNLQKTMKATETGNLGMVIENDSTDEIGDLINGYNSMSKRLDETVNEVYQSKIKEKEYEMRALQAQINPHFLFNVLENIRMRSILKHEDETAEMIEQLSLIERQYVEWGTDIVSLGAEIGFVESYLKLQKYRFGDRLRYSIEMEDDCREYQIPKLSLVTFTENSCVHGIEGKASQSWIFVRVYKDKNNLHLEVEDTGEGMPEEYLNYLQERMEEANIEMLKEKGRVGVINACVRLKMYTGDHVKFHIESERGVGTEVSVVIPLNAIS